MVLLELVKSQSPYARPISQRAFWESVRAAKLGQIEAALYKAGVPEQFYTFLKRQLRKESLLDIATALLLYEGLSNDPRLDEKARVQLIPELVNLVGIYGSSVFANDRYLNEVVDGYLFRTQQVTNETAIHHRLRDRHASERKIIHGSVDAEVTYGVRGGGYGEKIRGKVPASRVPSATMIRKSQELVDAVNRGNWPQATERYHDLIQMDGHLFYNAQTYRQFLTDVGSIILQRSTVHRIELDGVKSYGFPTMYSITEPELALPKTKVEDSGRTQVNGDGYADRRYTQRRIIAPVNAAAVVINSFPVVQNRGHHPKLERILSRVRI